MKTNIETKHPAAVVALQAADRDGASYAAAQATVNTSCRRALGFFASAAAGIALTFAASAEGFNFNGGGSSGGGSFSGYVGYYQHRPVGTTVAESTIPVGINGFTVTLTAASDVDVELWSGDTLVVGWGGRIDSHQQITGTFNGDTIAWSGYNGIGGNLGKESITIQGTSRNTYVMKVFGYQAGNYTVVYSFSPPSTGGNGSSGGSGSFSGYVGYYQHRPVGTTVAES